MRRRAAAAAAAAVLLHAAGWLPLSGVPVARAAEYTLETGATYDARPADGVIEVEVQVEFTNTTPDPPGQFSVFDEVKLAIHDEATEVAAEDADGSLSVSTGEEDGVNVATVTLRDGLRYTESAEFALTYRLPDTDDPQLRVRSSLIVFPVWSFGTASEVSVTIPDGYEVRVDGDALTPDGDALQSGPIDDPSRWLALVSALGPTEFTSIDAAIPLGGGTADLRVRSFADDPAWGEGIRDLMVEALPLIEEEIGLPYPRIGQLTLTQAVGSGDGGFGEPAGGGNEILVAYDQPPFTALHQVTHVWFSSAFIDARWLREGMASEIAARVAARLGIMAPYDPIDMAKERADAAFALDDWGGGAGPGGDSYAYAASWAVIDELETAVGADAIRLVLRRVAAGLGPYQAASIEPEPAPDGVTSPKAPLTTRGLIDHLETVTGMAPADVFAERVLAERDTVLLDDRAVARADFDRLTAAGGSWGAPDPIRGAMTAWSFDAARRDIAAAEAWLSERALLFDDMMSAGLAVPERLQQVYRSHGGGAEAVAELEAQRAVVRAYAGAAGTVTAERSFVERIGLIGGPDPAYSLGLANGRFADGDLRGAVEAITEAEQIVASADTVGLVRLLSALVVVLILLGIAVVLFRRRASYTAAP
jgi:hypothetical protein